MPVTFVNRARPVRVTVVPAVVIAALVAAILCCSEMQAQPRGQSGGPIRIALPTWVNRADMAHPTEALRQSLHAFTAETLGQRRETTDAIVVFVDAAGRTILPEQETSRIGSRAAAASQKPKATALSFTFNSSAYPWTEAEISSLRAATSLFYPVIAKVYGDPAFSITVNISKDPTISYAGLYYPALNEIVLPDATQQAPLCHEVIHAFHDDDIILLSSFEEGMARAAEVEVFDQLGLQDPAGHDYTYDVFYDALNLPEIGSQGGAFSQGYVSLLLRYQLAGYAWAKPLIEEARFFQKFNASLYAAIAAGNSVAGNESMLVSLAAAARPEVEGASFASWYAEQHVLNTSPPAGYFLYQRINQFTVDYFYRDPSGAEFMQPYASIAWSVFDAQDEMLSTGVAATTNNGWTGFIPSVPESYSGRLKTVVYITSPGGAISATSYSVTGSPVGVFGVVRDFTTGSVTVRGGVGNGHPVSAPVVNGAFWLPTLGERRGQFTAEFVSANGVRLSKVFTKDAAPYFVIIE